MPTGLRLALALVVLAVGCRHRNAGEPSEVASSGAWPELPAEGYAVLPAGTRVFVEPRFGARSARMGWAQHAPPPWPSGGHVVRVLGGRDGFVEIAPLPASNEAHCEAKLDADAFDLRLYVSPWSLASVLTQSFETQVDGGGSITLRPGSVVRRIPGDDERWAVSAGGVRLRAELPDDIVGHSYAAPEPMALPGEPRFDLEQIPPLHDGEGFAVGLDLSFGHDVVIESVLPVGERFRVELVTPCARATVLSEREPAEFVRQFEHFDFGLGSGAVQLPITGALDARALVGLDDDEPLPEEEIVEIEPQFHFPDEPDIEGELLRPEEMGFGPPPFGGIFLGTLTSSEVMVEAGAPIYLTEAGPPSGTLEDLRLFSEDSWAAGERLCFRTAFSVMFDPFLAICIDADEARPRSPQTDPHDFGLSRVRPGPLRVSRGHDHARVARALRQHRLHLRRCHEETLARTPSLSGTLELVLDTDAEGTVTNARLRSAWLGTVSDCVLESARTWTMPPTRDGKPGRITFAVELERQ